MLSRAEMAVWKLSPRKSITGHSDRERLGEKITSLRRVPSVKSLPYTKEGAASPNKPPERDTRPQLKSLKQFSADCRAATGARITCRLPDSRAMM